MKALQERFRIPRALGARLEELGVSLRTVLQNAGLPVGLFAQEKVWMTTEERFRFYAALEEVSADPAIGLKLGTEDRLERYNPTSIVAIYSRSFREAIVRIGRYKRLTCPLDIRLQQSGGECAVQYVWLAAGHEEPPILTDQCFSWIVSIGRRGTGHPLRPVRVEFTRPERHRAIYEGFFGCPVRFNAEHNQVFFSAQDIDRPFATHNPELLELVAPQLEAELSKQSEQDSLASQIKATLKLLLPGQRPKIEDVAEEMGLSPRTLQRRLQEEGLTFQHLVQDSRQELSRYYLSQPSLELNEIGYLLGYGEPNSFTRAFQKWEGTTPGQWRSRREPARSR